MCEMAKPITYLDKLLIVRQLYEKGEKEVAVRKLFNATTGQKLYSLCRLNSYFPALKIVERCLMPDDRPAHIPIAKLRHDTLVIFCNRYIATCKRATGQKLTEKEERLQPMTEAIVDAYFDQINSK